LGSVGVVFGDIGTSPLYAFRDALGQSTKGAVQADAVMGVVSLALWALILVVTVKYVFFLMRADNRGEGGVLSLMALAQGGARGRTSTIFFLGCAGAALFFGDAIITPAISVLSAVEGLRTVPALAPHATPARLMILGVAILAGLFAIQSRGTARVGRFFGPVCLVWFLTLGALGATHISGAPQILGAISPHHGVMFLATHGAVGFFVLGTVFLTVTGAEALSADMGHFGRKPIQAAWLALVLPALALNYLGQGAFVLNALAGARGAPVLNADWFYLMAPEALRIPLVLLAMAATVIASQAVITGAFSLTQQAIQLGLLPRMTILRTSETQAGQIYIPQVNLMLAIGVLLLVAIFKSSTALAHAYGLAVTGTMAVTTALAFIVVRRHWKWSLPAALALIGPLFAIDLIFLTANAARVFEGGFVPLLIGAALFVVMLAWVRGSEILARKAAADTPLLADLLPALAARSAWRAPGTAVFLTSDPDHVPGALLHNLKHNRVLHENNLIVSVRTADAPRVAPADRAQVDPIAPGFTRVVLTYGFMESPNVPRALAKLRKHGIAFDIMATSFFVGRRTVVRARHSSMPPWLDRLFIAMAKNAANPTEFFRIPPGRVVEMGTQVSV
jgi:KUP system potassium uptake protein